MCIKYLVYLYIYIYNEYMHILKYYSFHDIWYI